MNKLIIRYTCTSSTAHIELEKTLEMERIITEVCTNVWKIKMDKCLMAQRARERETERNEDVFLFRSGIVCTHTTQHKKE